MGAVRSRPTNNSNGNSSTQTGSNGVNNVHNNDHSVIKPQAIAPRERGRYGVVHVKVSSLTYANRRTPENESTMVITPRGGIFYGSATNPNPIQRALANCGVPMLPPLEIPISDSRAHKLMVIHTDDWYIVPSQEPFSRHSGTCVIIGDKKGSTGPYKIKLGDCFRLGSVGVVVSEIKTESDEIEQRLDARKLQYLKDEALAFDSEEDMAALAADEEQHWRQSNMSNTTKPSDLAENDAIDSYDDANKPGLHVTTDHDHDEDGRMFHPDTPNSIATMKSHFSPDKPVGMKSDDVNGNYSRVRFAAQADSVYGSGGITNGERFACYMCYETHDTPTDPLVAPCDCKGDTRYLHVQCLQKWYHSSVAGPQARVMRTTGSGAPACKICGVAYKTTFKRPDGRRANLLEMECEGPYISLVVVTRHDTNPGLFNTKFRLNFGRLDNNTDSIHDMGFSNSLLIGRSSTCNMVLDYRTVSTVHAKICYENGDFTIQDRDSSNGTMVYLQAPMPMKFSSTVRVRMGRTTMTFQPKRSWTAALRSIIASNFPYLANDNTNSSSSQASSSSNAIVNQRHSIGAMTDIPASTGGGIGRRSSSTGALPSTSHHNNHDVMTNTAAASSSSSTGYRRRLSGGADIMRHSSSAYGLASTSRALSADELHQIMAESNLIAAAANNNMIVLSNQDAVRGGTNPRSSPNISLRDEEIDHPRDIVSDAERDATEIRENQLFAATAEDAFVRRILFQVDHTNLSYDPNIDDRDASATSDHHPSSSSTRPSGTTNSRRNSQQHARATIINTSSDDHDIQLYTPPLSPPRHHHQHHHSKESSIIIDEDAPGCVIGTSLDLMLEASASLSSSAMNNNGCNTPTRGSSSSSSRAFDVDGAVTMPPAHIFASTSSRASSNGFTVFNNNEI